MTPILRNLHWLSIPARLEFKILLLRFKCIHNQGPSYLRQLLKFRNPSRTLRFSTQSLIQNSNRPNILYYGERAFAFAAPKLLNSPPKHIKSASSVSNFKAILKTYLIRQHLLDDQWYLCSLSVFIFIIVVIINLLLFIVLIYCKRIEIFKMRTKNVSIIIIIIIIDRKSVV